MCFVNEIANTKEARLLERTRFILFKTMTCSSLHLYYCYEFRTLFLLLFTVMVTYMFTMSTFQCLQDHSRCNLIQGDYFVVPVFRITDELPKDT